MTCIPGRGEPDRKRSRQSYLSASKGHASIPPALDACGGRGDARINGERILAAGLEPNRNTTERLADYCHGRVWVTRRLF